MEGGGLQVTPWRPAVESIVRIGRALLQGFILTLLEREGRSSPPFSPQDLGGDDGDDEEPPPTLRAALLRVWERLSRDPEMESLVGSLEGVPPPGALAEVAEQLFRDGVNWGRVVVFFYFTYRVGRQALLGGSPLRTILDWALSFLQDRLSPWIQRQGGWGSILSYSPPPSRAVGSPEK